MACQGAAQALQLGQRGRHAAAQGVDDGAQLAASGDPVRVTVGGNGLLVDGPGHLDLDALIASQGGVDAGSLPVGEHWLAGVPGAADVEQWVASMTAVPEGVLLDALVAGVQNVAGELDDVERVRHLARPAAPRRRRC